MTKVMLRRVRILFVLVMAMFILLSGRLAYLQILRHDYYWDRSELNRLTRITLPAPRGEIYDRNGALLAGNRPGYIVTLTDLGDGYDKQTITYLSEILGIAEEEINSAIKEQLFRRYMPLSLQTDADPEIIARISEQRWKLKGVNIEVHPIRDYPHNAAAAHVLGYLGEAPPSQAERDRWAEAGYDYQVGDLIGQDGIERTWEPWLRGQDGAQLVETNYLGQITERLDRLEPAPGHNIILTLDLNLQQVAEAALARRVEAILAEEKENGYTVKATAVVLNPDSGAILAMANYPAYNLNTFRQDYPQLAVDPRRPLVNTAIMGVYPPGSTFKMVTGAAVLEEGLMHERDIIRCPGVVTLVGETVGCFRLRAHGALNFFQAMAVSCNIYFYRAGLAAGIDRLTAYAREFGFGASTGLTDLRGEVGGTLASREDRVARGELWYAAETMFAAIGQQYNSFTALQLANYVAIIANGGYHMRPYLVQSVVDVEGKVVRDTEPELIRRAGLSERTLALLRESMRQVTNPGGTAWFHLSTLPVTAAGKTGSAETGVAGQTAHSLFVGYAPFENPEIAVAVIVQHGGIGATGGLPVAAEIMEYYFTGIIKGVTDVNGDVGSPAD